MIDLSQMKACGSIPKRGRCGSSTGCTSGDVDHATHAFPAAVPFGIVSSTGVGGLTQAAASAIWRKHGLTIDNLLAADVVLADGSFITANKDRRSGSVLGAARRRREFRGGDELPVRGASGEDGLCRADLLGREDAVQIMRAYREFTAEAPESSSSFVGLKTVPSMDPFPREGERQGLRGDLLLQRLGRGRQEGDGALLSSAPPIFNWMGEMPFPPCRACSTASSPRNAVVLEG